MKTLTQILSIAGVCAAALLCGQASAQIATGPNNKGPIDITADSLDKYDDQHLVIYRGNVEAVQNGARLVCDVLNVYFNPSQQQGQAAAKAGGPADGTSGFGSVKQVVADGHVFYVTQTQTARGEHAVYDAEPDTITMTGDVVVVQGDNVLKGDRMVIEVKSGHTQVFANATGRNKPNRVRGVFYNNNQTEGQAGQAGQPGQAAPAAPAPKR